MRAWFTDGEWMSYITVLPYTELFTELFRSETHR
jgi:hypothetical protein